MFASHTRLETADACPFRFYMLYIRRIPEPPSPALLEGKGFHKVAELYGRHCVENRVPSDLEAIDRIVRQVCFDPNDGIGAAYYESLRDMAQEWARQTVFDADRVIGFEERLPAGWDPEAGQYPEPNLGRHLFVGVVDLLEMEDSETLVITDYKTERVLRTQAAVERDRQLRRYVGLVAKEYPQFERFRVRLVFPRFGVTREAVFHRDEGLEALEVVERQLDQLEAKVAEVRSGKAAPEKVFEPTPGDACAFCSFVRECPVFRAMNAPTVIQSDDEARKAAQEVIVLRRRIDELSKALQAYFKQAAPIVVGGQSVGYHKKQKLTFKDARAFAQVAEEIGESPWPFLSVDMRRARKLLGHPEFAAVAEVEVSTRFGFERVEQEDEEDALAEVGA